MSNDYLEKEIETSDFYFVCYLKTLDFKMHATRKVTGQKKLIFVLRGKVLKEAHRTSESYYSGKAKVNAIAFAEAIKELKSYIYDGAGKDLLEGGK